MKVKDILETKHTVLASTNGWTNHNVILSDYTQTDLTLRQILFQFSYKCKDAIDYLRSIKDEKEQKKHKLNLTFDEIDDIIKQGKELGVYMYIYTGGEPLVRKNDLIKLSLSLKLTKSFLKTLSNSIAL